MNLREAFDAPAPAIILAEGAFGTMDGKTANGVVMHSELFDAKAVIDSTHAGEDAGEILGRKDVVDVPIVASTEEAIERAPDAEALVIGVAPAGGALPDEWVADIEEAIRGGLDVVSGLHVFLSDQPSWQSLADEHDTRLFDVRKPPEEENLRVGDGKVDEADADVVLTIGTDCAVGKRTTTFELYRAAKRAGLDAGWVATGQTGIMVGAHRGVVIDRVPADFTAGVVENLVFAAAQDHDIVFVEGQAALTHRAYSGVTLSLLHGAWPNAVVLVDEPNRERRTHFEQWPVGDVASEIGLVTELSDATVAGVSTWADPETVEYPVPAANVYHENGSKELLDAVREVL
ncbi:DUF1611 domain-containing protein [Haladaptatus pallidirubidus]|uniref:DUF1611 domain-containing protein n=1 Tax=Haladaptatus pallidirubidus TaxID=1008152 RepID=A0AAV3UNB5_9EURY|nr:DUF1611 domain-containing protein [Haladaptatus pallidirubidus]